VPRTESAASSVTALDRTVLAVGAVVLVAVVLMGVWLVHMQATASATPPHATATWSGNGSGSNANGGPNATASVIGSAGGTSDGLDQTMAVSVRPGSLTVSPATESVTVAPDHGRGSGGPDHGDLAPVTVVDARGSVVGWNASVSLQAVDGLSASQLARARLCATPDAPTIVAGNPGEVGAAALSCGGVGVPVSVFFASPGGGGTFSDTAALMLVIPGVNATR
jgi:hypothetical protein